MSRWRHRRKARKLHQEYLDAIAGGWVVATSLAWAKYVTYCTDHHIEPEHQEHLTRRHVTRHVW